MQKNEQKSDIKPVRYDAKKNKNNMAENISLLDTYEVFRYISDLHLHPQQQQQEEENSMSLWVKTQQLRSNPEIWRQVQGLYGMHFPLEVRHYFADWIEQKPW